MTNETPTTNADADASSAQAQPNAAPADTTGTTGAPAQTGDAGKVTEGATTTQKVEGDQATTGDKATETKDNATGEKPGVPETYEFKFGEGVEQDPETIKEFSAVAKELGLTQENAQKLADFGPKLSERFAARQNEVINQVKNEWKAQTKADTEFGGVKLEENLAIANKALKTFGTPALEKLLIDSGLGEHPEVIRAFYHVGKGLKEDGIVTGSPPGNTGKTAAQIIYGS